MSDISWSPFAEKPFVATFSTPCTTGSEVSISLVHSIILCGTKWATVTSVTPFVMFIDASSERFGGCKIFGEWRPDFPGDTVLRRLGLLTPDLNNAGELRRWIGEATGLDRALPLRDRDPLMDGDLAVGYEQLPVSVPFTISMNCRHLSMNIRLALRSRRPGYNWSVRSIASPRRPARTSFCIPERAFHKNYTVIGTPCSTKGHQRSS